MVRITTWMCRVPVIKFRKGGAGHSSSPQPTPVAQPSPASCAMKPRPAAPQAQPAAAMSTGPAIPDIDLPARYRRTPLSEEEINQINGGGIA